MLNFKANCDLIIKECPGCGPNPSIQTALCQCINDSKEIIPMYLMMMLTSSCACPGHHRYLLDEIIEITVFGLNGHS